MFLISLLVGTRTVVGATTTWPRGTQEYRVNEWTAERGLPQNSVDAILQTRDGYLWVGTRFGLARFDGIHFTTFDRSNTPEMSNSDACLSLAEDDRSTLWIGTDNGLLSFRNGIFGQHFTGEDSPQEKIWALCHDPETGLWIGTDTSLTHYSGGRFERHPHPNNGSPHVNLLSLQRPGQMLVHVAGQGFFWFHTRQEAFKEIRVDGMPVPPWNSVVAVPGSEKLWIATERELHGFDGTGWTTAGEMDGLPPDVTRLLSVDGRGGLWLISDRLGLFRYRRGTFNRYPIGNRPRQNQIGAILEDQEGNIWIGTDGDGLFRLQRRRITAYSTEDGLSDPHVWSVWPSRSGGVWVGTRGGLHSISNGAVRSYDHLPDGDVRKVRSVFETRDGTLWIGSHDQGLRQFRNGKFTRFSSETVLGAINDVRMIYEDRSGNLWFGHNEGVARYGPDGVVLYSTADGLPSNRIRAALQDRDGSMWLGTYDRGACRIRDGQITCFNLPSKAAWAFHQDVEGILWIGTERGLVRRKDGRFFTLKKEHGLHEQLINQILEDDAGNLWLSGLRGIYHVKRSDLNRVADGLTNEAHCVAYGVADGMLSAETNGEHQPAGCRDEFGHLWFPTIKGVVALEPENIRDNDKMPQAVIEEVRIDENFLALPLDPAHAVRLAAGSARLVEIRYTATSLSAPDKVRFRYRLKGYHDNWREVSESRVAHYANLRPGKYAFEIRACNNHGYWNPELTSFSFVLPPYFHQTRLFYALCIFGLIAAVVTGLHLRIRVLKKIHRLERQHDVDMERARIARDLHDELGSNLTQIAILSELAGRGCGAGSDAKPHIQRIGDVTAGLFNSLDEVIWAANPKQDTLEGLVSHITKYSRDYLQTSSIRCRFELPDDLPHQPLQAQVRHDLFLVTKEALNNAVKHSDASEVWIRVHILASALRIAIEDNGRGIQAETAHAAHTGNGLTNMRERLKQLGGRLEIVSPAAGGTRVTMTVDISGN